MARNVESRQDPQGFGTLSRPSGVNQSGWRQCSLGSAATRSQALLEFRKAIANGTYKFPAE